jgi:hypothetical protein
VNKPGPEVPCADMAKAFNQALPGPWTFDVGQFVQIETTVAPVNQPESVLGETTQLILSAAPSSTAGSTTVHVEQTVYQNGAKDATEQVGDVPTSFFTCPTDNSDPTVSFHSFSSTKVTLAAPINTSGACDARYPNCTIKGTQFQFDELVHTSDETIPVHYVIVVSNEVPYFARTLQNCMTYPIDSNGQKIPITKCDTVLNFLFSSN